MNLAGRDLTVYMMDPIINKRLNVSSKAAQMEIAKKIKEKVCYVAKNLE
jgi:actin-related protein